MAEQRYEYYDDRNSDISYRTSHWGAQTFTPSQSHEITKVRLKLYQTDATSLGDCIFSIQGTDGTGHPDGSDIVSKTINQDWGTTPDTWQDIVFDSNPQLNAATKYAIVIRAPTAPADKSLLCARNTVDPAYGGGNQEDSTNSGSSWDALAQDWSFEEWGNPIAPPPPVGHSPWGADPKPRTRMSFHPTLSLG